MRLWNYALGLTMTLALLAAAGCGEQGSTGGSAGSAEQVTSDPRENRPDAGQRVRMERYTINDDGTVSDKITNRTWLRCSLGQQWDGTTCRGEAEQYQINEARQVVQSYSYAGQSDWRLPTVEELGSLIYCSSGRNLGGTEDGKRWGCDGDYQRPTIFQSVFPATPEEWFWTSSNSPHDREYFWSVNFGDGAVLDNDKINRYHLRLVRTTSGL